MSTHLCPSRECEATHREQGIHMWHPEGKPHVTQFLPPDYTEEYVEGLRKSAAGWWGVPEEAVIADMDTGLTLAETGQKLPVFKLAPGWKKTQVIEHPREGVTTIGYRIEREEKPGT